MLTQVCVVWSCRYGTIHQGVTQFYQASGQTNRFTGSELWLGQETLVNALLDGNDLVLMRVVRPKYGEPGMRLTVHEKWTRAGVPKTERM